MRDINDVCKDKPSKNIAQTIFKDTPKYNTSTNVTKIDGFDVTINVKQDTADLRVSVNIGRVGHGDSDDNRVACFYIYRDDNLITDIIGNNGVINRNATFCVTTAGGDYSDNSASFEFIDKNITKGDHTYDIRLVCNDNIYINRGYSDSDAEEYRFCSSTIIVEEL